MNPVFDPKLRKEHRVYFFAYQRRIFSNNAISFLSMNIRLA